MVPLFLQRNGMERFPLDALTCNDHEEKMTQDKFQKAWTPHRLREPSCFESSQPWSLLFFAYLTKKTAPFASEPKGMLC